MKQEKNLAWRRIALAIAGLSAACSHLETRQPPALQAAWVVLGEQGLAVARVITSDAQCPVLLQDGAAQTMRVRAAAASVAQRKTISKAQDTKPAAFPVLTCEAALEAGARSASVGGRDLPLPKPAPQKIVVIGDTGCRLAAKDNYYQSCNDSELWAFRRMAETAAAFKPDLVVHVGDYHYRENACPQGHAECAGSPWGYGWDTWQADFFAPAAPLLAAAPWVVVRGNHETCERAGQGWWRFLDPRPLQAGRDCNLADDDRQGDYSAPYAVPLAQPGAQQAQLIVFDSAKAPNLALDKSHPAYRAYLQQVRRVDQLAAQAGVNFFVSHHPVLGFGVGRKDSGELKIWPGNGALQDVLQDVYGSRLFPASVQAALAGHVHLFEVLSFASDHPTQFISGNGGSSLDAPLPQPLPAGSTPYPAAQPAYFGNSNRVGFMTIEREPETWKILAWDKNGKPISDCRLQNRHAVCHAVTP
ncbi:MAG: metallophosphoesterase [Burkholderiales bacterium]|nr:metallophosphoesterase [Burkholderiales bacterium]